MPGLSFSQKLWGAWKDYDRLVRHRMFGWNTDNESSAALENLVSLHPISTSTREWNSYSQRDRAIAIELANQNHNYTTWTHSQQYFKVLDFLEKLICRLEGIEDIRESDHCPTELKAAYVPTGVAGDLQQYKSEIEQLLTSDSLQSATKAILETLRDSLGSSLDKSKELFTRRLIMIRNNPEYNNPFIKKEISRLIHSDKMLPRGISAEIASTFQGLVNSFFDFCIKNQIDKSSSSLDHAAIEKQ
jgi:hypothetical protein